MSIFPLPLARKKNPMNNVIDLSARVPMPAMVREGEIASWTRVPMLTGTRQAYLDSEDEEFFLISEDAVQGEATREGIRHVDMLLILAKEWGCVAPFHVEELRFHESKSTAYRVR